MNRYIQELRTWRTENLGLSVSEMAQALGVHRQTYTKWERGEREPSAATARLIETLIWLKSQKLLDDYLGYFD